MCVGFKFSVIVIGGRPSHDRSGRNLVIHCADSTHFVGILSLIPVLSLVLSLATAAKLAETPMGFSA